MTQPHDQPSSQASLQALSLRTQAVKLLEQAQALDGLRPYDVRHEYNNGESHWVLWSAEHPAVHDAVRQLDIEFEPEREEYLSVGLSDLSLAQLCGADESHVLREHTPAPQSGDNDADGEAGDRDRQRPRAA